MRKISVALIPLFLLILIAPQIALAEQADPKSLERLQMSIGSIVLEANRSRSYQDDLSQAGFGDGKTWAVFFDEYEKNIRDLPIDSRVEYLWFGMWFLKFGSHTGEKFTETVARDCPYEFTLKLRNFIDSHRGVNGDPKDIYLAEKILGSIESITKPR